MGFCLHFHRKGKIELHKTIFIVWFYLLHDEKMCKAGAYSGILLEEHLIRVNYGANSNTSCLEAHVGFFRLLMKEIFGPYVL